MKNNKPKVIAERINIKNHPELEKKWNRFLKDNNYKLVFADLYTFYEIEDNN